LKFLKNLLGRIFISIILNILNPIITVIVSKLKTGSWFSLFNSPYFITTSSLLVSWFIISLVYRRAVVIKERNTGSFFASFASPTYGWEKIAQLEYRGVKWIIEEPIYSIRTYKRDIHIDSIEAQTPARCPKCETELEEKVNFFGRYVWTCILCHFKKSNKENMYKEAERATRIAKRQLEQQKKQNQSYN